MARNEIHIDAPPARVFDVLADVTAYADWVVGSKEVRDGDRNWPNIGTRFHHTIALGPIDLKDHTEVEEVERPRKLVLRAKTRPLGAARVSLRLEPQGDGTKVTMEEQPVGLRAELVNPVMDLALRARNVKSLRRLKALAERSG